MFPSPIWSSQRPTTSSCGFKSVIQPDVGETGPVYLEEHTDDVLLDSSRVVDGLYRSKSICTDDLEDVAFGYVFPADNKSHKFLQTNLNEDNKGLFRGSGLFQVTELQGKPYAVFLAQSTKGPNLQVSEIKYNPRGDGKSLSTESQLQLVAHSNRVIGHKLTEIQVQPIHDQSYVLTKSSYDIKFSKLDNISESVLLYDCKSAFNSEVTCMTLNDSIPGMWAMTLSNGQVSINDAEQMKPMWQIDLQNRKKVKRSMWYGCKFSMHPLCLLLCTENNLFLCDTRASRTSHSQKLFKKILGLDTMEKWIQPSEVICNIMPSPDEPLIYITSANYVLLFDQRFCSHPVLKWRHMMDDYPCFTSILKDGDTKYYIGCNARSKQLCQISRKCGPTLSTVYNWKTTLPRLFSVNKWFKNRLKKCCKNITYEVEERFDSELIGFSILEELRRPGECFALFLNKYSDIFNQSLYTQSLTKTHVNLGTAKDPDRHCCNAWICWSDNVKEMVQKKSVKTEVMNISSTYLNGVNEEEMGFVDKFDDLPLTMDCRDEPKKHEVWNVKKEVDSVKYCKRSKIKRIDWNPILADNFVSSEKNWFGKSNTENLDYVLSDFIPKKLQLRLSMNSLKLCKDQLALVVMDKWEKSIQSDEDLQFHFHTEPFKMSGLNHISSKIRKGGKEVTRSVEESESISESVSTSYHDRPVSTPLLKKILRKEARKKSIAGF